MIADAEPYEALAELIEAERGPAAAGDLDALARLRLRRERLVATLPATPPAAAAEALHRCARVQAEVRAELARARASLLSELAQVRHAQRAAAGYRPARDRAHAVNAAA